MDATESKEVLVRQLTSASGWEARRNAAMALGNKYPDPDTVALLISTLQRRDENQVVRFVCAEQLGSIGDAAAVGPLIESLEDDEKNVVAYSARALAAIGDERAIEPLVRHLKLTGNRWGSDYAPIEGCQQALGKFGGRAVPPLLAVLSNKATYGEVILALALTGDPAAMPAVISCARDSTVPTRYRRGAIIGLAKFDQPESKDALRGLLGRESSPELLGAVKYSLEKLGVDASDSLAEADVRSKQALLKGLKALKVGMRESEVEKLVGPGGFKMGTIVVYKNPYGEFQLNIVNGTLVGIPDAYSPRWLIEKLEAELPGAAPTDDSVPPTADSVPPTADSVPPTADSVPPTAGASAAGSKRWWQFRK